MYIIEEEYNQRKSEINDFFILISHISQSNAALFMGENDTVRISTLQKTSLKATCILLLYNLVEATVTTALNRIHHHIIASNKCYTDFSDEIKSLVLSYYYKAVNENRNNDLNTVNFLREFISISHNESFVSVSYENMVKFYSLYSGNLDAKKIKQTLQKYGIICDKKTSELQLIKNNRNKLAHGEISFCECGRDLSFEQLVVLKDKTYEFLEEVVGEIKDYVSNQQYLKQ